MLRNETKDLIYEYLTSALHMTHAGACGFLANLQAESGCCFDTVEGLLIQRLSEDGQTEWKRPVDTAYNSVYNNLMYTARVNKGVISKEQFLSPRGKHYGYGLCQWTTESRKSRLWRNTRDKGKPIDDPDGQLQTLKEELEGAYLSVLKTCQVCTDCKEAADYVLRHFEQPHITQSIIDTRRAYADAYDKLYKPYKDEQASKAEGGKSVMTVDTAIQRLLETARAEIGYLEKRSKSDLDSKTRNAGSANFTKYWRDLKPSWNGSYWCDCFVSWLFFKAFGKDAANTLLCGGLMSFDCDQSASYYKRAGRWHTGQDVQAGDQIFFGTPSDYKHTGIVESVSGGKIYTIEGNTSGASGVVANGGGVCRKSYYIGNARIMGYGRPNWSANVKVKSQHSDEKTSGVWKATGTATVAAAAAHVRKTPEITGTNDVMTLKNGNRFEINGEKSGQWVKIKSGSTIGWMHGSLIKYDSQPSLTLQSVKHTTTAANVRTTAGVADNLVKTFGPSVPEGTEVRIEKTVKAPDGSDWAFCYLPKYGKRGYIAAWLLK